MTAPEPTKLFPNWSMQTTQQVATIYVCVQGVALTALFTVMLLHSKQGQPSRFVTLLSVCFMIGNIALAIATVLFNKFEGYVLHQQWHEADLWAYPFNVFMAIFVIGTCIPHFFFFQKYFECCLTLPYFYSKKKVPCWLQTFIYAGNVLMIVAQGCGPIMTFVAAQRCNNYYFGELENLSVTSDFSGGSSLANHEKFWLNFLVVT